MRQISLAVLIPERTAVNNTLSLVHQCERLPWSGRILCLGHEYTQIRITIVDEELAVMIAYRRCPHGIAVVRGLELGIIRHLGDSMADDSPVDKILGMEHGEPRDIGEAGCCHIIVISHTYDIRIGIVSIYDGINVFSVAEIGAPDFRDIFICHCGHYTCGNETEKRKSIR